MPGPVRRRQLLLFNNGLVEAVVALLAKFVPDKVAMDSGASTPAEKLAADTDVSELPYDDGVSSEVVRLRSLP